MKYHREQLDFAALKENNIDRIQLALIPPGSRILEIGCGTGHLSEYLVREQGCSVLGVELEPAQAEVAAGRGFPVFAGSITDPALQARLDGYVAGSQPFAVVFMSQVIEHLAEPEAVLARIKDWLASDGVLIISTCNIAHWRCRLRLLRGKWEYEDYGIFDRGHLRFFTPRSFARLLEDCGYEIMDSGFSFEDICPCKLLFDFRLLAPTDLLRCIPLAGKTLRRGYAHLMRNLIATQFVYKARVRQP